MDKRQEAKLALRCAKERRQCGEGLLRFEADGRRAQGQAKQPDAIGLSG